MTSLHRFLCRKTTPRPTTLPPKSTLDWLIMREKTLKRSSWYKRVTSLAAAVGVDLDHIQVALPDAPNDRGLPTMETWLKNLKAKFHALALARLEKHMKTLQREEWHSRMCSFAAGRSGDSSTDLLAKEIPWASFTKRVLKQGASFELATGCCPPTAFKPSATPNSRPSVTSVKEMSSKLLATSSWTALALGMSDKPCPAWRENLNPIWPTSSLPPGVRRVGAATRRISPQRSIDCGRNDAT